MKKHNSARLRGILTRRFFGLFVRDALLYTVALGLFTLLCIAISGLRIWYAYDPMYQFLSVVQEYLLVFFAGAWLIGILFILWFRWRAVAESFLTLYGAIGKIAQGQEGFITLPGNISELQEPLRRAQYQAMRGAQLAAEAEQRKNDMVVYLAHDLKTPLTSVLGYLELLRDEPDISPQLRQKYLAIATDKALRLETLINEFFEITRFSLQGLTLETGQINLTRMLEQICSEFAPMLAEKELSIAADLAPGIEICADAGKLERVMDNLMRNAVNYSHPRTEIRLGAKIQDNQVVIQLQNQGETIPEHKRNRIFEQFYRMDEARSSADGGSGLGLAIAREIVGLHGGTIEVESQNGLTVFTVVLPMDRHRDEQTAPQTPTEAALPG